MAKHASFGVASSSTGVNQTTTLSWNLPVDLLLDGIVFYFSTKLHELCPQEEAAVLHITGQLRLTPDNDSFDPWQF